MNEYGTSVRRWQTADLGSDVGSTVLRMSVEKPVSRVRRVHLSLGTGSGGLQALSSAWMVSHGTLAKSGG
jgi:hypothetical protein